MLSTREGAAAAPGRGGAEPAAGSQPAGHRAAQSGGESRAGPGVQEHRDGSRYEGEFVNGLKHGRGRYTWRNGQYYEGSFYKDFRHGDGQYCWPKGHKFTGKFYLNRREGYGQQVYSDGATFQGLYHLDQKFGPGVFSHPDGREDVGVWHGEQLLKLCTPVEGSFSLRNFPEYAAYMDPAATTDSLTQPPTIVYTPTGLYAEMLKDPKVDLPLDEKLILPDDFEKYSTDGEHLPLPPGRRRELDRLFYGELWNPDAPTHPGYERDPLAALPLPARLRAHIHNNRRLAENVGWDVAAVLSLNREGFGPKGPLEVSSELMIQHASRGELQAMSEILLTGLVHPDVEDSQGNTALIAATVNCHDNVIHRLLDMMVDIDKLNCEGMSALAVCHVLYYPFQSLHTTLTELTAKTKVLRCQSVCGNSPQISQVDSTTDTPRFNDRPQTTNTTLSNQSYLSDQHRVRRLSTLKLLLERGSDPNVSRVPMPVLFLAIMAADTEAVKRLLLSGARTDICLPPERKGLYPLHVAAALPGSAGPRITELLLHAITDTNAQACDQDEIYEPDKIFVKSQKSPSSHLKEGGRTALHVACQRDSDYRNASKVVALLLSHRASTDLLWSGHSPLSLAIATGNDLAVEELLKGGANPNIPLGRRVGSALCALANINYHLGGNRAKLLDMLVKAGADISMPVMVGDVVGTAVDYAHYSFKQDLRIANAPFQALNMRERETLKARRQLLSMMGDRLRQIASQREREREQQHLTLNDAISSNTPLSSCETEESRKPVLKFCYHCGRSVSVKLTACSRCQKVYYCSSVCRLKAWDEGHKKECIRVSGSQCRKADIGEI